MGILTRPLWCGGPVPMDDQDGVSRLIWAIIGFNPDPEVTIERVLFIPSQDQNRHSSGFLVSATVESIRRPWSALNGLHVLFNSGPNSQ